MIIMGSKGGSWIDNIYQRLEAMCVEVEEVIYEKFYSDVMQDLHSPSPLDPVKPDGLLFNVDHQDNAKTCKTSEIDDEMEPVDAASEQLVKDFDGAAACDSINCSSGIYIAVVNNSAVATSITPDHEIDEPSPVHLDASLKLALEANCNENEVGISRDMLVGYRDGDVMDNNTRKMSGANLSADLDTSLPKAVLSTTITCVGKSSIEVDEELLMGGDIETSSPSLSLEIRRCDDDKLGIRVGEHFSNVKLDESCVLVEKSGNHANSACECVQKSYKKRIKDVFSPRRWSKSKRDHEQFAAWYEEQTVNNSKSKSASMWQAEIQKLQISESCESDWELL
ncbi:UDP-N-acetylmuramate--L-alanine ligase [Bienertia sinuspersici]